MTSAYLNWIGCQCYRGSYALLTRVIRDSALLHSSSCLPTKKPRNQQLAQSKRQHNRLLARLRIVVEHVNLRLKIFRILAELYRNRRRRFGLRFNLISAILNSELPFPS
jgi:DDE superfamily endonuclease